MCGLDVEAVLEEAADGLGGGGPEVVDVLVLAGMGLPHVLHDPSWLLRLHPPRHERTQLAPGKSAVGQCDSEMGGVTDRNMLPLECAEMTWRRRRVRSTERPQMRH